jgi:hypothetical protein
LRKSGNRGEDLVGGFDPLKRFGRGVMILNKGFDGLLELLDRMMVASLDLLLTELGKPAFDLVQPRTILVLDRDGIGFRMVPIVTHRLRLVNGDAVARVNGCPTAPHNDRVGTKASRRYLHFPKHIPFTPKKNSA